MPAHTGYYANIQNRDSFHQHGLIPWWISNNIHHKVWNAITYSNFNGADFEFWEWISNLIPHFTGHVINCPLLHSKGKSLAVLNWIYIQADSKVLCVEMNDLPQNMFEMESSNLMQNKPFHQANYILYWHSRKQNIICRVIIRHWIYYWCPSFPFQSTLNTNWVCLMQKWFLCRL